MEDYVDREVAHGAARGTWCTRYTPTKRRSPAAQALRYFKQERAESHLAEEYGSLLKLPPAQSGG